MSFDHLGPPIKSSTAIHPSTPPVVYLSLHAAQSLSVSCCLAKICISNVSVTYVTVNPIEVGYFILSDPFFRWLTTLVFDGQSLLLLLSRLDHEMIEWALRPLWSYELCCSLWSEYKQEVQWVNTNPSSQSSEICNNTSECTLWIICIADYPHALDLLTYYLIGAIFIYYCVSQAFVFLITLSEP